MSKPSETPRTGQLSGKVAVITGGTRGLGYAIAEAFIWEGAAVVLAARDSQAVEQAAASLRQRGGRAGGLAADVASLGQVEALADHAVATFGQIDVWVNNAGLAGPYGPTIQLSPPDFTRVVETNILGVYHGSRAALQRMLPQSSGKLINLLGHGYRGPVAYQNAYASSKAWVKSFTLALAEEVRGSGVDVFAFNPGMVLTDLLTDVEVIQGSEDRLERFPLVVSLLAQPPEIPAEKVVWLASPASDGKGGRVVSVSSPASMLGRMAAGGLRSRLGFGSPPPEIRVRSIQPDS